MKPYVGPPAERSVSLGSLNVLIQGMDYPNDRSVGRSIEVHVGWPLYRRWAFSWNRPLSHREQAFYDAEHAADMARCHAILNAHREKDIFS